MKTLVFCTTQEDQYLYEKYNTAGLRIDFTNEVLKEDNVFLTEGYDAIVIQTRCIIDAKMAKALKDKKVSFVLTRSAGYDHMDLKAIKENGLRAANVSLYSPNAIAEYVCMVIMMLLRKATKQLKKIENGDFRLNEIRGMELRKQTVGVIGGGRIGFETIKILSGFGGKILVNDPYKNAEIEKIAEYVELDEIYKKADIIVFHCPLLEENYHMINDETIEKMKNGVILVNPARGGLWDYEAVCDGLISGKIAAAGFDVYEQEKKYLRKCMSKEELPDSLRKLLELEQVIYTAHAAFYTDVAIENMIEVTIENLKEYEQGNPCKNELIKGDL